MGTDEGTIERYFEQAEWKYTRLDANVWQTGLRGRVRNFTIHLRLTDQWLFLSMDMLNAPNPECTLQLYQHLLRLNFHMNMVKFSLESDGEIALRVELPVEGLEFSEFQTGLLALSTYAEQSFLEIANLAMHPNGKSNPPSDPPNEIGNGSEPGGYL